VTRGTRPPRCGPTARAVAAAALIQYNDRAAAAAADLRRVAARCGALRRVAAPLATVVVTATGHLPSLPSFLPPSQTSAFPSAGNHHRGRMVWV